MKRTGLWKASRTTGGLWACFWGTVTGGLIPSSLRTQFYKAFVNIIDNDDNMSYLVVSGVLLWLANTGFVMLQILTGHDIPQWQWTLLQFSVGALCLYIFYGLMLYPKFFTPFKHLPTPAVCNTIIALTHFDYIIALTTYPRPATFLLAMK